jgi:replicative DNA helicase
MVAQRAPLEAVRSPNRIPPHNLDAEQSVLGAMLESREAIANVIEIVKPDDFYKPAHTEIYDTILTLHSQGEAVDAITVADELSRRGTLQEIGGKPYIHGLLEAYPTATAAGHYARIVDELAILRRLVDAGNRVQEIGFSMPEDVSSAVDEAEGIIYEVGDRRLKDDYLPIRQLLTENMEMIETLYERGESVTGLATGFSDLDDMTSGFQPSNLIIVAARPSMGKSSMLNDFALHSALKQREPVVVFSLEMSRHEVVQRMLASEARVDMQRIKKGSLQEQDWTRLSAALGRLAEAPVFIDDSANVTLMEMRAKCRRLKGRHGLGLVVIDYLQLMQSPKKSENRQQEVSEISRALKIMAKDLDVPVVCASQLNRGVEYRSDKRPLLGDLRESGCLTGDTLVALASGERAPISSLVGDRPEVVTIDGWHMQTRRASKVWRTGRKPVFKLTTATGRTVRATANHPFRTLHGWTSLEDLSKGSRIGVPRAYPETILPGDLDPSHLVLLGHLIGDGSFLRNLPLRYASQSEANIAAVVDAAKLFGVEARVKYEPAARCSYVFLPAPYHLTPGRRNPIAKWLDDLGLYDKRSHEKFVPEFVFSRSRAEIGLFLRHLWATDGCVWLSRKGRGPKVVIYYGTNSPRLAHDVQHLLARLGIISRIKSTQKGSHRPGYNVTITGSVDQLRFALIVGGHGERALAISEALKILQETKANTNRDTIPIEIWDLVKTRMRERGVTHRAMAAMRNSTYGGTSHFKFAPSRSLLNVYAEHLEDVELKEIANSDVFWDTVVSIDPDGVEDVYDMTVPSTHNFVANGLILHNSIEQDSDLVMFIYRDEVYNPDSEQKGEAELIVAKHRNGPTGLLRLAFMNQYTKFANIARGPGF